MYAALGSVLVPGLLARADEASKESNLAIVMTLSSLVTLVLHPLVGAWSDRGESRWGRRSPWIVGGALSAAVAVAALGQAVTVVAVGVGWLVVQPLLNVVEAPLDAVLADRVPVRQRPRTSAFYSGGAAVGLAAGALAGGLLIAWPGLLSVSLAVLLAVTMLAFVRMNPEGPTRPRERPMPWRSAWRSRDLRLVFVARALTVLGSQLVLGYLLYVVMDATGASVDDAGRTVSLVVGIHIAAIGLGAVVAARLVGDRRRVAVMVATGIVAGGLVIPLMVPGLTGLIAYAVVSGLGRGAYLTADLALMLDVLPSGDDHGRDLGLLGLATIIPQVIAPAVAGLLLAASGDAYSVLFGVAPVLVAASIPLIWAVSDLRPHPASEVQESSRP